MSFGESGSPYESPQPVGNSSGNVGSPAGMTALSKSSPGKPAGYLAVSIITLILGGFGLLYGACCEMAPTLGMGALAGFLDTTLEQAEKQAKERGDEDALRQMEAGRKPLEVQQEYFAISIASQSFGLLVSLLMVIGGIMGLTSSSMSKPVLLISLLGCIPARIFALIVYFIVAGATADAQREIFEAAGDNASLESIRIQMMAGNIFYAVMAVAMIGGYGAMILYLLLSKGVKRYFAGLRGETFEDGV